MKVIAMVDVITRVEIPMDVDDKDPNADISIQCESFDHVQDVVLEDRFQKITKCDIIYSSIHPQGYRSR